MGFTCSQCGVTFKHHQSLNCHKKVIHGDKPIFTCTKCNYIISWSDNFNRHLQGCGKRKAGPSNPSTHTPWSCPRGSRQFKEKFTLTHHLHEIHAGEKNINAPPAHMSQIGETLCFLIFSTKTVKRKPTLIPNPLLRKFRSSMMMDLNILKLSITKYMGENSPWQVRKILMLYLGNTVPRLRNTSELHLMQKVASNHKSHGPK